MATMPIKIFTGKKLDENSNIIDALQNFNIVEIPLEANETYDSLRLKCARYCHVPPLYFPLFALWRPAEEFWVKLSRLVERSNGMLGQSPSNLPKCCLEFRIRYLVRTELEIDGQKKMSARYSLPGEGTARFLNEMVTNYLFRQTREDFLSGRINFYTSADCTEDYAFSVALGVAAMDLVCLSKMVDLPVKKAREKVKVDQILPEAFCKKFAGYNYLNRMRVRTKFKHFLRYLSPSAEIWQQHGRNSAYFQGRYLLNIELSSVGYGKEKYGLIEGGFVTVSADSGIVIYSDANVKETWCVFSELTDMTVQTPSTADTSKGLRSMSQSSNESSASSYIVTLGRYDGEVKKLYMKSLRSAENLASCIDGFYQLLVDAHHYLCKDLSSSRMIEHLRLGCHGPISCAHAEDLLKERVDKGVAQIGDCIIRQSRETYDEYFVNTIFKLSPVEIRNYMLDRGSNRLLGLYGWAQSHGFESLEGLLNACAGGQYLQQNIPIDPHMRIPPKPKHKNNLLVRLCSDQTGDVTLEDTTPKTVLIELQVAESYREVSSLGNGTFTSVKRYAKHKEMDRYLVFKFILDQSEAQQNHHIHKSFQESMAILNRLDHRHIIQQIGLTLSSVVGMWLEYMPHKSINEYLRQHQDLETPWFWQVLWQIAHACHYLEEKGFAHGNLCGKNILLQKDLPHPHAKIADSGVRTRISVVSSEVIQMPVLTAPWVAYEFCYLNALPRCDRYPTIEGDKWSFGTTACEIFNWGALPVQKTNAYELTNEMKEWYRRGDLISCMHMSEVIRDNKVLCDLLTRCWSTVPVKRPPFQQILREIGSILTGDYVRLRPERCIQMEDSTLDIVDLPTFEDEKLTRISKLGEGHFGFVGLFSYDQNRNGQGQLVAVKEPTKSSVKQQREFMQEIETMKRLNHRYVVRLLGITEPSGRIVMEYLKNGSLAEKMKKCKEKDDMMHPSVLLQFSSQIAEGMIALQERRLVHRDLALRNILLGDDSTNYHIKISDFGLSRFVKEEDNYYTGCLEEFPAHWYAPECLCIDSTRSFGFKSDVWSFGVTIWEMFSYGEKPNYPPLKPITHRYLLTKLFEHLRQGNRLMKTPLCPVHVYEILQQCWEFDKNDRPTFEAIKREFDNLIPYGNTLEC